MSTWYLYIVRCADDSLYTGITTNVTARIAIHNAGKGAKYTRSRRPVVLVKKIRCKDESRARKREMEIKKCTRAKKEAFIQ